MKINKNLKYLIILFLNATLRINADFSQLNLIKMSISIIIIVMIINTTNISSIMIINLD